MGRFAPLVIPRNEWERLKNQANPKTEPEKLPPKVDIEAMNELSRKWTSTWPDTEQGHVKKALMKKKKMHLEEIADIDAFHKKIKHENTAETLKRAKDTIFERTGYGRELLSALFESKTLDEREIQIKFLKEIKEKEKNLEETKSEVDNIMYAEFEKGENKRHLRKQKEKTDAECNKLVAETKREEALRAAAIEQKNRLEDAEIIEKFYQLQLLEEKRHCSPDKEAVQIYEEHHKAIREMREKREIQDQVLADVWCKHQNRVYCKEKQVFDQMFKEKHNTRRFKENYELVQRLQDKEEKKYNDFVDKGVKEREKRLQEREIEESLKREEQRRSNTLQAQYMIPESQRDCEKSQRKLSSDKQSFLPTRRGTIESKLSGTEVPPPCKLQFLAPHRTLQQALKRRQAQPGGWSGTAAAHVQFARHAAAALAEATHKRLVQKVVNSYCKTNNVKDLLARNY